MIDNKVNKYMVLLILGIYVAHNDISKLKKWKKQLGKKLIS